MTPTEALKSANIDEVIVFVEGNNIRVRIETDDYGICGRTRRFHI